MRLLAVHALCLLLLAGCARMATAPGEPTAAARAAPSADATASPLPRPGTSRTSRATDAARAVKIDEELYEFAYSYPAAAGAIAPLRARLDAQLEERRAELIAAARQDQDAARKAGYPYRRHSSFTSWAVVTENPQWLSLSAKIYTYSGGAHGMTHFDTLLWDKRANMARAAIDLFSSKAALGEAVRPAFCTALDQERAKRRGSEGERSTTFTDCIDAVETVVILGSASGQAFDRIGFLIEPYAAGPYAEGTYEITLPVTAALVEAVKPEFRAAFTAR